MFNHHLEKETEGFLDFYVKEQKNYKPAFGILLDSFEEHTTINISEVLEKINIEVKNKFQSLLNSLESQLQVFLKEHEPEIFILWSNNEPDINAMINALVTSIYCYYYVEEEWDTTGSNEARDDKNYRKHEMQELLSEYENELPGFMSSYEANSAKIAGSEDYQNGIDIEEGLAKLFKQLEEESNE